MAIRIEHEVELGDQGRAASRLQPRPADFELLYREHARGLRAFVRRHLADPDLVEDIVQETFLRAHRSWDRFEQGRPAWPWLATIARNLCVDVHRRPATAREERRPDVGERLVAPGHWSSDPEVHHRASEQRAAISEALGSIAPRQRRLLVEREVTGLPYAELAEAEGISHDALKSTLKRARQAFRHAYSRLAQERGLLAGAPVLGGLVRRWRSSTGQLRHRLPEVAGAAFAAPVEALAPLVAAAAVVVGLAGAGAGSPPPAGIELPAGKAEVPVTVPGAARDGTEEAPAPAAKAGGPSPPGSAAPGEIGGPSAATGASPDGAGPVSAVVGAGLPAAQEALDLVGEVAVGPCEGPVVDAVCVVDEAAGPGSAVGGVPDTAGGLLAPPPREQPPVGGAQE